MRFKEKTVVVADLETFYIEAGEGETLIFIHGWGARSYSYKKALSLLAKKYHVIALDLPGFGRSASPKKVWDFGDYAQFISLFISQNTKEHVTLVGHSLGGGIALYAATQSTHLKQLVLLDAVGLPIEHNRLKLYYLYTIQLLLEMAIPHNWLQSIDLILNFLFNAVHLSYIIPFTYKIFERKIATDTNVFKNVRVPTQILWGKKDTIFGKNIGEKLEKVLPNATLAYVDGTHNWIIFKPHELKKLTQANLEARL